MQNFSDIYQRAVERKNGVENLTQIVPDEIKQEDLMNKPDSYYLSWMVRCIFRAGFYWSVIEKKWPDFEEVFHGFDIDWIISAPPEFWEEVIHDARIVRNGTKIQAIKQNAYFIKNISEEHGSFGNYLMSFKGDRIVELWDDLKKRGTRLGGNTRQWFLRSVGKDTFVLSKDVVLGLKTAGLDISDSPTSKRDLNTIQYQFNIWEKETGFGYAKMGRILAYSVGKNYETHEIVNEMNKYGEI